jgi:hypothetical protein
MLSSQTQRFSVHSPLEEMMAGNVDLQHERGPMISPYMYEGASPVHIKLHPLIRSQASLFSQLADELDPDHIFQLLL